LTPRSFEIATPIIASGVTTDARYSSRRARMVPAVDFGSWLVFLPDG
jgi:hypothetical protein